MGRAFNLIAWPRSYPGDLSVPSQSLAMLVIPVFLMREPSCLLRPHLACTAGDRTQLLLLSSSLTDRIASLSVKVPTSTLFSHTSTTPVPQTLVSTFTLSLSALRSTSHLEPAIFSRIDNATLQLVLSTNAIGGDETAKVRVYATNYNVLRVMSGMGGLAYSN